jgi:hypothetical protein
VAAGVAAGVAALVWEVCDAVVWLVWLLVGVATAGRAAADRQPSLPPQWPHPWWWWEPSPPLVVLTLWVVAELKVEVGVALEVWLLVLVGVSVEVSVAVEVCVVVVSWVEVTVVTVEVLVVVVCAEDVRVVVVVLPFGAVGTGPPPPPCCGEAGVTVVEVEGTWATSVGPAGGVSGWGCESLGGVAGVAEVGVLWGVMATGVAVPGPWVTGSTGRDVGGAGVTGVPLEGDGGACGATGVTVVVGSAPPTGGAGTSAVGATTPAAVPPVAPDPAEGRLAVSCVPPRADELPEAVPRSSAVAAPTAPLRVTLRSLAEGSSSGHLTPARWLPSVATAMRKATAASATGTAKITRRRDTYLNIGKSELQHKPRQSFVDRFPAIPRTSVHLLPANPSMSASEIIRPWADACSHAPAIAGAPGPRTTP